MILSGGKFGSFNTNSLRESMVGGANGSVQSEPNQLKTDKE